jgi:hypothetical protein
MLERPQAVPPREQRILAPSLVGAVESNMGVTQCACSLRVTDVVNLVIYYVPMTREMAVQLIAELEIAAGIAVSDDTERNHN